MDAKDLKLALNTNNTDFEIIGEKEVNIPIIMANNFSGINNFDLFVLRRIKPGEYPIVLKVSQADFPENIFEYIVIIVPESEKALDIAAKSEGSSLSSSAGATTGPIFAIANPPNGLRVRSNRIKITGSVADNIGIERVEVQVDGMKYPYPIPAIQE